MKEKEKSKFNPFLAIALSKQKQIFMVRLDTKGKKPIDKKKAKM